MNIIRGRLVKLAIAIFIIIMGCKIVFSDYSGLALLRSIQVYIKDKKLNKVFLKKKLPYTSTLEEVDELTDFDSSDHCKVYSLIIKNKLTSIFDNISKNGNYDYFISVYDFSTNIFIGINEDKTFYPASLIKTFYLYGSLEQVENKMAFLEDTHTLSKWDKYVHNTKVTGTGSMQYNQNGRKYSFEHLLSLMITVSDNIAANIVMDYTGINYLNQIAQKYNMKNTQINRKFYEIDSPLPSNFSTAKDLNRSLILLENRYVSDEYSKIGIDFMKKTINKKRIGRYMPKHIKIANKTGTFSNIGGDMALIYYPDREPLAMTIVLKEKGPKGLATGKMELEIAKIAKEIVDYFMQYKYPDLFVNGKKIQSKVKLRYIENLPYISFININNFFEIDENMAVIINNNKYYSLQDIKSYLGYDFDLSSISIVHLYKFQNKKDLKK